MYVRRLKSNVALFCNGQEAEWRETNAMTQEALSRLDAARSLVRSLGLNAHTPGGHELASDAALLTGGIDDGIGLHGSKGLGRPDGMGLGWK